MPSAAAIAQAIARFIAAGYPSAPSSEVLHLTVETWCEDLADLSDAELAAACAAYRRSTDAADRWFPTPGRILAFAPTSQVAAAFGAPEDVEAAFIDFRRRVRLAMSHHQTEKRTEILRDPDPHRDAAMQDAIASIGGMRAWEQHNPEKDGPHIERRWREAYKASRRTQAKDPAVVRAALMLTTSAREQKRLTVEG